MYFFYRKDYYVCIMGEHVVITSNPNSHFTNSKDMNDITKDISIKKDRRFLLPLVLKPLKKSSETTVLNMDTSG